MAGNRKHLAAARPQRSRSLRSLARHELGVKTRNTRHPSRSNSGIVPWRSRAAGRPCRPGWAAPQPVAPAQSVSQGGRAGWISTLVVHIVVAVTAGCIWMVVRSQPVRAMVNEPAVQSVLSPERRPAVRRARSVVQPRPRAARSSGTRDAPRSAAAPTSLKHTEKPTLPKASPTRLTAAAIVRTVKQQSATVKPCLAQAWRRGQLESGRSYRLILSWTIEPDGRVTAPRVVGPAAMTGTPLAACFRRRMREWTFPVSVEGAPVRNYPFGPFTIR